MRVHREKDVEDQSCRGGSASGAGGWWSIGVALCFGSGVDARPSGVPKEEAAEKNKRARNEDEVDDVEKNSKEEIGGKVPLTLGRDTRQPGNSTSTWRIG